MPAQYALTFLFNVIALSFIAIASLDFSSRTITLYNQVFIFPKQLPFTNSQPQVLPQLPEEWLLPQEAVLAASVIANQAVQYQAKSVLMLAEAKAVGEVRLPVSKQMLASPESLEALLLGVDLNTLKLRPARKIAKALGIAQKVNNKDQKISWLRAQKKAKLQQKTLLLPEVMAVARGKLIAC